MEHLRRRASRLIVVHTHLGARCGEFIVETFLFGIFVVVGHVSLSHVPLAKLTSVYRWRIAYVRPVPA
jgi:hypothetical protein